MDANPAPVFLANRKAASPQRNARFPVWSHTPFPSWGAGSRCLTQGAWGEATNWPNLSTDGNPYGYTGREWEQTNNYYYRNRFYKQDIGRFISRDPIGGMPHLPNDYYKYVRSNPIRFVDPLGLWCIPAGDAVIGQEERVYDTHWKLAACYNVEYRDAAYPGICLWNLVANIYMDQILKKRRFCCRSSCYEVFRCGFETYGPSWTRTVADYERVIDSWWGRAMPPNFGDYGWADTPGGGWTLVEWGGP